MKVGQKRETLILLAVCVVLGGIFAVLYWKQSIKVDKPDMEEDYSLNDWTVEDSSMNDSPLEEDKRIYPDEPNNELHDVYISVFPTKDENGEMIDFSSFDLHTSRNHEYNPTLNCNIQILDEGEMLDPLLNLDAKNATIRVRGNSSRGDEYKSYKVKFTGEDMEFEGQTILNLNKHSEDFSKITTKFCTDVLQDMDNMVSYRTNFMRVWIRDASLPKDEQEFVYYGLFTHIEQPNKRFLEARGLSTSCEMYKARDFSFRLTDAIRDVDDPDYSEADFEQVLGIREADSHEKLIEMLEAVNDETRDFEEVFETYFDEENYLTWLAFNLLVGGDDILNHNFIIYSPVNSQKWYFITWDYDSNLAPEEEVLPESLKGGQKLNQVVLHRRYFRIPGNLQKLEKKMEELIQNDFSEERIHALTEGYKPVLNKTMALEPDIGLLRGGMTPADLIPYVDSFDEIIMRNYQNFKTAFQYPAPMFVSLPTQNPDGTLHLAWDNSYSYQQRTITYRVQIANDCHMKNILFEQDAIYNNSIDTDIAFEPGVYYLKVFAIDSEGNEQVSLEHYEFDGASFIYESGVLEFTVE